MTKLLPPFCLGVAAVLISAEIGLRLLPVPTATITGYHHDPDVLTYPAHHRWTTATGWDLRNAQTLQSNNWGFVAEHEFQIDPGAVALIGDSFVEASMLEAAYRPGHQLEVMLGGHRKIFSMGTPGTALLDYAQRIRLAREKFQIHDFVILLERFDARQSLCGSGNVVSRCLDPIAYEPRIERQAPPSVWARIFRRSALAQYGVGQLRIKPSAILKAAFTRSTPEDRPQQSASPNSSPPTSEQVARTQKMVDAVISEFYRTAVPAPPDKLIFVVDGRRGGGPLKPELIDLERAYLIQRLRDQGAAVVDMEPVYAAYTQSSPRSLDVGPYDRHLNALGVHLAMMQAASILGQPKSTPTPRNFRELDSLIGKP